MRLTAREVSFNIAELFCHDSNKCQHPYDNGQLADILTEMANDQLWAMHPSSGIVHIEFVSSDDNGLSRWTVHWKETDDDDQTIDHRIYSPTQLFDALPVSIVAIIRRLNQEDIEFNTRR